MSYISVSLEPIDPLLFRDNRMARAGDDHVLTSQMPSPYTIFGAIGNHITKLLGIKSFTKEEWSQKVQPYLGSFIMEDTFKIQNNDKIFQLLGFTFTDSFGNLWFPAPKHLLVEKKEKYPIEFLQLKSVKGLSSNKFSKILERNTSEETLEQDFYIDELSMEKILCGEFPSKLRIKLRNEFIQEEYRTGLGIDYHNNVTKESLLFNRPYWRFTSHLAGILYQWKSDGFIAWIRTLKINELLQKLNDSSIGIVGGDRNRAIFNFSSNPNAPLNKIKEKVIKKIDSSKGYFAYLLTPLPVKYELIDFKLDGKKFDAAAIGKPIYTSGWLRSFAGQRPRKLINLAPSGSVFFYEWKNENDKEKAEIIKNFWLASLTPEYKIFGFGRILIGVWK